MTGRNKTSRLLLLLLLSAAVGVGAVLLESRIGEDPELEVAHPTGDGVARPAAPEEASVPSEERRSVLLEPGVDPSTGAVATSVVHPLAVELTLVSRGSFPQNGNLPAPRSDANARLKGRIVGDGGAGVRATITFTAGPNLGRELRTDSQGRFGASDLYQGLAVVFVQTDRGVRCEREVALRQLAESQLNLDVSRVAAASVRGTVRDPNGELLEGAEVRLDGQTTFTDLEGEFFFPRIAPDKALAVVRKHGYARRRQIVPVMRSRPIERDRLTFTLHPGASLEVGLDAAAGGPGPALLYVLPVGGHELGTGLGERTFPWYEINPIEVHPGGSAFVEGLQPGHVSLMAFRVGAIASPPITNLKLIAGRKNQHKIRLKRGPCIRGVVRGLDGEPAAGARVRLEAPAQGFATTKAMQRKPTYTLAVVLPHLPAAAQEVVTNRRGEFALTVFPKVSRGYYLTAESSDGSLHASRAVTAESAEVELTLEPLRIDAAALEVRMGGRYQGLPIDLTVNGTPRDTFVLPPDEPLVIDDLEPGLWRAEVWWHHEQVLAPRQLSLEPRGQSELLLPLPMGAIEGQTDWEAQRAGGR